MRFLAGRQEAHGVRQGDGRRLPLLQLHQGFADLELRREPAWPLGHGVAIGDHGGGPKTERPQDPSKAEIQTPGAHHDRLHRIRGGPSRTK
jgi:hypothetical protein